jgi:hypothetical protein
MDHSITTATGSIYDLLYPFSPEDRLRIVKASLTLLGDPSPAIPLNGTAAENATPAQAQPSHQQPRTTTSAEIWMKKYSLTEELLEQYFLFEGDKVTVISLPSNGKSKRSQTIAAYLIAGAASLLSGGDGQFADETAKAYCEHFGCFDSPNHAKYLREGFGNLLNGSKSQGWKLTSPGQKEIARLLQESASEA